MAKFGDVADVADAAQGQHVQHVHWQNVTRDKRKSGAAQHSDTSQVCSSE